jgi:hypothetical protein
MSIAPPCPPFAEAPTSTTMVGVSAPAASSSATVTCAVPCAWMKKPRRLALAGIVASSVRLVSDGALAL